MTAPLADNNADRSADSMVKQQQWTAFTAPACARHHTSVASLKRICYEQAINPARGEPEGVHVETEPFGSPLPGHGGPQAETGAVGDGAFVEFDLPANAQPTYKGPRHTAVIPSAEPLRLQGRNPKFVKVRRWSNLWYFWR
jgi:hypothetical protein